MTDYGFKSVEVRYQTALVVPPPYAHFFTISLRSTAENRLAIAVTITYTEREELEEDEIIGEGFTTHDDFQWSGTLPAIWQTTLNELVRKTQLKPFDEDKLTDNQEYFQITIEKDASRSGAPSPRAEWQFLGQELIQATYELSGKEKPFEATYIEIESGNRSEVRLTGSFSHREARLEIRRLNQNRTVMLPWKEMKTMMEAFYGVDYNPEQALSSIPKKPGRYLNLGTAEWYELSTIEGEKGAIDQLNKVLNRLLQS